MHWFPCRGGESLKCQSWPPNGSEGMLIRTAIMDLTTSWAPLSSMQCKCQISFVTLRMHLRCLGLQWSQQLLLAIGSGRGLRFPVSSCEPWKYVKKSNFARQQAMTICKKKSHHILQVTFCSPNICTVTVPCIMRGPNRVPKAFRGLCVLALLLGMEAPLCLK